MDRCFCIRCFAELVYLHFRWAWRRPGGQVAELIAFMAKNRSLSFCKVVEVIAETTAPLTPAGELLSKIPAQREDTSSPKVTSASPSRSSVELVRFSRCSSSHRLSDVSTGGRSCAQVGACFNGGGGGGAAPRRPRRRERGARQEDRVPLPLRRVSDSQPIVPCCYDGNESSEYEWF